MRALIQACLATLTRLPGLTADYDLEVDQRRGDRPDAMVTIRTAAGTDRYAAEAKAHVTSQSLSSLLSHLTQVHAVKGARAMLLTTYAPPAVANALAARGVAYADASGNAHLNGPAAYVLIRGQRPQRIASRSGLTTTDLHLVFALLRHTDLLRAPLRQVAEATGISLGKVSTTIRTLSEQGFVQVQGRRRRLRDPERLLRRWEVGYLEAVRPRLHPSTWRLPPGMTLDDLRRRALGLPDVLIGGEFAADALTQSLRPGSLTLHAAPGGTKRLAVALRVRPLDSTEPEVILIERFLTGFDQADAAAHANRASAIVHPILARVELLALGSDRLREIADRLRDEVILPGLHDDA